MEKIITKKIQINMPYLIMAIILVAATIAGLAYLIINKTKTAETAAQNNYNMAFYEVVNYVQDVETYLAKSLISSTPEHGAETLTNVWREANLAQAYLAQLPISSNELENTEKFLNQVSDYSFSLSRKNIYNEKLSDEDLKNLRELHAYCVELNNTLSQLSDDINSGRLKWNEVEKKGKKAFAQQVSSEAVDDLSHIEEDFHQYSGLIYDGAFSEHIANAEKRGLTGDDIDDETAKQKAIDFIGKENIKEIESLGFSENATIPEYDFYITNKDEIGTNISISKKGGHIVYMNSNRDITEENISQEEASKKGKEFLDNHGVPNMKATYYLKQDGIVTINYAYTQNDVVIYSDLIKVKVALDNGEILGIESKGYLNNHTTRNISNIKITKEKARQTLNKDLDIKSEGLAIIPTEFKTEILCYEFKGEVEGREFLVYINAQDGKEEDVLMITNTPNGTLTM